ncbi:MAG: branched-chain amino acid ABC transporter permease, partial [Proteobacteria bacterium]|nr:branched-chain amino acid ABC transporter permease [Pseudomonadota bacterium]
MFYRENGQFKSSYAADQQLLPIRQDRIFMFALVAFAFVVVPLVVSDYIFLSLLIPFLILALAAIGLNLVVGYCGQISIGHAAFMAVGAYAAYNFVLRVPQLNFLVVLVLAGLVAAAVGMLLGI